MPERRTRCSLRRYRYCHTSTSWKLALDQISHHFYLPSGQGIDVGLKYPGSAIQIWCDPESPTIAPPVGNPSGGGAKQFRSGVAPAGVQRLFTAHLCDNYRPRSCNRYLDWRRPSVIRPISAYAGTFVRSTQYHLTPK